MNRSDDINELATALSKAQGEMKPSSKSGTNPFFKHSYATFDDVLESVKKPLADNGLAFMQMIDKNEDGQILISLLMHGSGQWISSTTALNVFAEKGTNALQDIGKAITYMKRYALSAMLGVSSDEDDDGDSAKGKVAQKPAPKPAQKPVVNQAPKPALVQPPDNVFESAPVVEMDDAFDDTQPSVSDNTDYIPAPQLHWIDVPGTRNAFWGWTHGLGLKNTDVYDALGTTKMHSYTGDVDQAKATISEWLDAKTAGTA